MTFRRLSHSCRCAAVLDAVGLDASCQSAGLSLCGSVCQPDLHLSSLHLTSSHFTSPHPQEVLAIRKKELGPLHPDTLKSLDNAGKVHRAQGNHKRALAFFEQALEGRRKVLGSRDISTLRSMNHVGSALHDKAMRFVPEDEGEDAAQPAAGEAAGAKRSGGNERAGRNMIDPTAAAASPTKRKSGGFLSPKSGGFLRSPSSPTKSPAKSSRGPSQRASKGAEASTVTKPADAAKDAAKIAAALERTRQADLDRARGLYREALDGCRSMLGDRHPLTITSMNNLGNLLHACGLLEPQFIPGRGLNRKREDLLEQGTALLREALDASKAVHGERHIETLIGSSNLGSALRTLGGDLESATMDSAKEARTVLRWTRMNEEATGLIREAVAGIVGAKAELETMPLLKASVLEGFEQHPNLGKQSKAAVKELEV